MFAEGEFLSREISSGIPLYKQRNLRFSMLVFVFGIIFMINLLINIDHGVIPAATTKLKVDLSLDNSSLGLLGSIVYIGLTLGNIIIFN